MSVGHTLIAQDACIRYRVRLGPISYKAPEVAAAKSLEVQQPVKEKETNKIIAKTPIAKPKVMEPLKVDRETRAKKNGVAKSQESKSVSFFKESKEESLSSSASYGGRSSIASSVKHATVVLPGALQSNLECGLCR